MTLKSAGAQAIFTSHLSMAPTYCEVAQKLQMTHLEYDVKRTNIHYCIVMASLTSLSPMPEMSMGSQQPRVMGKSVELFGSPMAELTNRTEKLLCSRGLNL